MSQEEEELYTLLELLRNQTVQGGIRTWGFLSINSKLERLLDLAERRDRREWEKEQDEFWRKRGL